MGAVISTIVSYVLSSDFKVLCLGALLSAVFMGLLRWWRDLHEPLRVLYHEHDKVWSTVKYSDVFRKGYRPPWWVSFGSLFFSGTWHTLAHNIVRETSKQPDVKYDRELVALTDGGTVGLDWAVSSGCPETGVYYESPNMADESYPIVFLHHGLCGSSRSHYIISAVNYFLKTQKYRVVCMLARGCGGVPLTTDQGFHAARADDMRQALKVVCDRYPESHVYGVGWSLGAGLMANYIGEEGKDCKLSGACVISPCWDFMSRSPWFPVWSKLFLAKSLVDYTKENIKAFENCDKIRLEEALAARHVEEYDHNIVVQKHDHFETVDDYYRAASPLNVCDQIMIPTLSINSDDDPVCHVGGCPTEKAIMGPGLTVLRTKRGGHTSWARGSSAHSSWMDEAILTWINGCNDTTLRRKKLELEKSLIDSTASSEKEQKKEPTFEVLEKNSTKTAEPSSVYVTSPDTKSLDPKENSAGLMPYLTAAAATYLSYRMITRFRV